jgi:hypothetical protein
MRLCIYGRSVYAIMGMYVCMYVCCGGMVVVGTIVVLSVVVVVGQQ